MTLAVRATPQGVEFAVKAVPGSSRDRVVGVHGDALKIAVTVPRERGRANARLLEVLAAALSLPRAAVVLVGGSTSAHKCVRVMGLDADTLRRRLGIR